MFGIKMIVKLLAPKVRVKIDTTDSTCFDFEHRNLIVGYDFDEDNYGFTYHLKNTHKCRYAYKISHRLWAVLHELGHYYTEQGIEDSEQYQQVRAICMLVGDEVVRKDRKVQAMYFNLPSEWAATEWAINWVKTHKWQAVFFNFLAKF